MWEFVQAFVMGLVVAIAIIALVMSRKKSKETRTQTQEELRCQRLERKRKIQQALAAYTIVVAIRNRKSDEHTVFETIVVGKLVDAGITVKHLQHSDNRLLLEAPKDQQKIGFQNDRRLIIIGGVYWATYNYDTVAALHLDMRAVDTSGKVVAARYLVATNNYDELAFVCLDYLASILELQDPVIDA